MVKKRTAAPAAEGKAVKCVTMERLAAELEYVAQDAASKGLQQPTLTEAIPHFTVAAAFRALSRRLVPVTPARRAGKGGRKK